MTGEGREYGRRKREGSDEDEEIDRMVREMRSEIENEESPEPKEHPEREYDPEQCVREAIREIQQEEAERLKLEEQKESKEEPQETKEKVESSDEWDVDECVRTVIEEVQEEEAEHQRLCEEREHAEMEKEQQIEASYESRKETADKDELDEYEEKIREAFEEHGIDPEEVKERWRKKFEEEVQDELGEQSEKQTAGEEDESAGSERTAEGRYYYDDGSGQVYEVQMDSPETSSTEMESSSEVQEKVEDPQSETKEYPEVKNESEDTESKEQGPRPVREEAVQEAPNEQEGPEGKETETSTGSSEVHEEPQRDSEQKEDASEVREGRKQNIEVEDQEAPEKTRNSTETTSENTPPQEGGSESIEVPEKRVEQSTVDEYSTEASKVEESKEKHEEQGTTEERSASQEHQPEYSIEVPEDFDKHIEELLEDLIAELESEQEEEEVDESRIIVDPMTGREYIDRTYEPRPYFQDTEEETEEQVNLRARLAELFGELSEEEREKFKEKIRARLENEEDLDELIENNSAVRASPDFKEKYEDAKEYIRSGKQGEAPRLIKELLRDEVERAWSKIVFDRLVVALARRLNPEKKTKEPTQKESAESKVYPVNMWTPEIDGTVIESYDHLVELLKSRSPTFFKRNDADKLLKSARLHIDLYQEFGTREYLEGGEVAALSKKLKKNPTTLKRYLREGVMPKVYYWSNMVPSAEKEKKLEEIISKLNGVTTAEEYDRRFGTLYFYDEMSTTSDHMQKDEFARKFFTFLSEYMESGLLVDLAKRLKIGKSTINAWFDRTQLPTRIVYASLIPKEIPRQEFKWLPKRLNHITNQPEDFMQVPLGIQSPQDLLDVLYQLFPLDTQTMKDFEKELGELSQPVAFMYLLGLMVSDGTFKSDVDYSASAELFVSKKYSWGSTLGKGFCYALGKIGLSAERKTDYEKIKEDGEVDVCRVYSSTASPFLMWMKKVLLGLKISENKKNIAIKADWILKMPYDWRGAFIQGLADGDGYASIPRFDTAITTSTNEEFFVNLLSTVGIASYIGDCRAKIKKYDEIMKARELPLFRYATGRQKILDDLCKIIELKPKRRRRVPEEEKELVMELYRAGLKPGEIVEKLWYEYGMVRTTAMIETLIRRENKKRIIDHVGDE